MNWVNIIHFYQPPIASDEIVKEALTNSYKSWANFLIKHPKVKITINFTGCLTQRLADLKETKLLKDFSKLAKRGQVEFLETAAFHPILPLIPEKEVINQIKINHEINSNHFGKTYKPKGFFLPEMAYSKKIANIIYELGYKYIVLDEISLGKKPENDIKYNITGTKLNVVFRDNQISKSFVPETIINRLENNELEDVNNVITATDGELYGHWFWNWWPAYSFLTRRVKTLTVSEYLKTLKEKRSISPKKSSWESTKKELKENNHFALWHDPKNKIHKNLWQLADFALKLIYKNTTDPNHFASRLHLEKGLSSCTFWWASDKDFRLFSERAWHPEMVETGAKELLYSIRSLDNASSKEKIKAEKIFNNIHILIWNKHWNYDNKRT